MDLCYMDDMNSKERNEAAESEAMTCGVGMKFGCIESRERRLPLVETSMVSMKCVMKVCVFDNHLRCESMT